MSDQDTGQGTGVQDEAPEHDRMDSQEETGGATTAQDADGATDTSTADGDDDPRIKRANRDAARYRRELREEQEARHTLEQRLAALEKGKGDGEPGGPTAEDLEAERQRTSQALANLRRVSLRAELATQGAGKVADVDAALTLIGADAKLSDLIEWNGDEPTAESVGDAMTELLKAKPYLTAAAPPGAARSGSGSTASPAGSGGKPPKETLDERRARLRGDGTGSVWDTDAAAARGGGVVGGNL